jgi:hypothetical protein
MYMLPYLDDETPGADVYLDALGECTTYANGACGGAWRWVLSAESERAITPGVAADTRLAILNSYDVSGNDYTSRILSYRSGPTLIFGPAPSFGAFGPINNLPPHLGELSGGSLQHHDTLFLVATDDPTEEFATGIGVAPDVVVLQRQSDAVQGVDTMIEAARAWLLEGGA